MSRRFLRGLTAALAMSAIGAFGAPQPAAAAGQTITVWWNQGFYPAEDQAFRQVVADWEKKTGNKVDLTFYNGSDLPSKIISAMTAGGVPDICYVDNGDFLLLPQAVWNGKVDNVTDVVDTEKSEYSSAALAAANMYDNVSHKRAYYGVPLKQQALHYFAWAPMLEKAGSKPSEIPKTWNAFFNYFAGMQKKLRAKGMRVYGLGYSLATKDSDSTYLFNQTLVDYGGAGIVTPDGKLHIDDPKIHAAAVKALTFLTTPYKEGLVPPGAINWGDPDNNSAFYAKQIVMTPNATISIPVAVMDHKDEYYHQILTLAPPLGPDGKKVTSLVSVKLAFIPHGAKDVAAAKDFLKYLIQPAHIDAYLKAALGRWLPVMPSLVKSDPFWTDPSDPHRPVATRQELIDPTMPWFMSFNPAYADVNAQQIWGKAEANVMQGGMTPEAAVNQAAKEITAIFAKYPVPAGK
ncbi:MAG: carbohydrate ABC transporter substrate-binding protein [Rhodospirillales bacterium]|nr:carbohydrate ABC transporter substrate-binding protein [Rhodospirillales bacterium]